MTHEETFVTTSCPVARSVDLLGDRWMLMIIRDAFDGISRFSDFQKIPAWRKTCWPRGSGR
jgi:DNA-binding HxlR family transcriptional regulator